MTDISSERPLTISESSMDASSEQTSEDQLKLLVEKMSEDQLKLILEKLNNDPSTLTTEEARIASENVTHDDERSATSRGRVAHGSLLTVTKDLHAAVDASPQDVTTEILRTTQSTVSNMQKALGQSNAPHPEFEAELQEEIAKIEPKITQGTVTKTEADHLHSLEARAHGHTEKGGVTAAAQSVVARRERQLSLSSGSGSVVTPNSGRSRASSKTFTSPQQQSHHDKEENLRKAEDVTKGDAAQLQSREHSAHDHIDEDGLSAEAMSQANRNENNRNDVEAK